MTDDELIAHLREHGYMNIDMSVVRLAADRIAQLTAGLIVDAPTGTDRFEHMYREQLRYSIELRRIIERAARAVPSSAADAYDILAELPSIPAAWAPGGTDEPTVGELLAIYGKPLTTVNTDGLRAVYRAGVAARPTEQNPRSASGGRDHG